MIKRDELIKSIQDYFKSIYFDNKSIDELSEKLQKNYRISSADVSYYITDIDQVLEMNDETLFRYASVIPYIDILKYFSPKDATNFKKIKTSYQENFYPIIFENVLQVNEDQFVTTISASKLYDMYKKQVIVYNTLTQRNPRVIVKDGEESFRIYVNERAVKSIKSLLLQGLFIPNDITLNVRADDSDNVFYDEYNATFTLNKGTFDILDGYHRYQAIIRTLIEYPEFDLNFILNITMFPEAKAQRYIAQQDKKNRIRASYAKSLDNSRKETTIVKMLNEDPLCRLQHKFSYVKLPGKLDIGKAIDVVGHYFKLKPQDKLIDIESYIRRNINAFMDALDADYLESFDDVDFRFAIICIGLLYKHNGELDGEVAVGLCKRIRESLDSKKDYTIDSMERKILESGYSI